MVNAHKSSILINVAFYFYLYLFSLVFNSLSKNTNISIITAIFYYISAENVLFTTLSNFFIRVLCAFLID